MVEQKTATARVRTRQGATVRYLTGMSGTLCDREETRVRHYAYLPSGGVQRCKVWMGKELRREGQWAKGVGKGGQKGAPDGGAATIGASSNSLAAAIMVPAEPANACASCL